MNKSSDKNLILPFLILFICLSIAFFVSNSLYKNNLRVQKQELELRANDVKFNIQNRLNSYQQFSKSSASFFMSSDSITRHEWKEYIENSNVSKSLKGFQGVAFIPIVSEFYLENHINRFKVEYSKNYQVFSDTITKDITPILFIEPLEGRNLKAVGFNISSNPVMRKALEDARDFNEAVLTGKVILIQDAHNSSQPGGVIYSPIYKKDQLINTVEQRKKAIKGWSAISFRVNDFIDDLISFKNINQQNSIQINIYDGSLMNDESLLYKSESSINKSNKKNSLITYSVPVELNRKVWTLVVTQPILGFFESNSFLILIFGVLFSFLLSYLVYSYQNTALIAKEMAQKLTIDLSEKNKELINKNVLLNESYNKLEIAKEKAESSELQLKLIANNFVNGMIYQVATLDKNRRKFNYVSETVNKLYGCTVHEALENPDLIYSKTHPDDVTMLLNKEKKALENMTVFNVETRIINPDGSIRWSYIVSQPRIINGVVCWDGLEVDITERKKIELELIKAKDKAEESDRLKSAFLANMSHEIRTPMNSILGFTELLMSGNLSEAKKEHYYDIVHNSGKRLMNLISDIIDISKIDAHQLNLHFTVFNLNDLIDSLNTQFKICPKLKDIELKCSKSFKKEDSYINSDETRITQVLSNLIENAMKFTAKGSIEFGYKNTEDELLFFVKDTGVGIKEKDHQLIFDRFGQSENTINAKEGTGLGLSISKGIVENLGGKIWVESEPNKGANFYFTIPNCSVNKQEILLKDNVKLELESLDSKTILIAEDEESNFLLIEAILESLNFIILHAVNGEEAVALFNNHTVDLILMDFNMPVMNGLEATKIIRKHNDKVPIIALTAYVMSEDKETALGVGCNGFLSKPFEKNQLLEIIKTFLG